MFSFTPALTQAAITSGSVPHDRGQHERRGSREQSHRTHSTRRPAAGTTLRKTMMDVAFGPSPSRARRTTPNDPRNNHLLVELKAPRVAIGPKTGHLTPSVFERYNITDDRDRRDAVAKLAAAAQDNQVLPLKRNAAAK